MKREIRVIGIDDAPFDKFRDKTAMLVGIVYRGGQFMDGVLSSRARVDGEDATGKIASMVKKCKFRPQLRCIFLKGIAVAGFNVIDINRLSKATALPVIVVMRRAPRIKEMADALAKIGMENKIKLLENAGKIQKIGKLHVQVAGTTLNKAGEFLKLSVSHAQIPEPLRIAHLVAGGIIDGESRGHA